MIGKKVLNHVYWHCSVTAEQGGDIRQRVADAENLSGLRAARDYNVVKYEISGQALSLLNYPNFFETPFPSLETAYRIDLDKGRVDKRSYKYSSNPPILHRKELLLSERDTRATEYRELTETAEQLGLFDDTVSIGFRQAWENLIADKGFQLIDGQFVPIGNVETLDENSAESESTQQIARHLTALSRSNLSAPMQCLARHGFLNGSLSVFDYGCGKGDDIRNLTANSIPVAGWDPHYAPDQTKHEADIVNLGFVINVIENYQERTEALLGAHALTRQVLVVSAMLFNQNAWKGQSYNDGVITQRNTFQKYYTQSELKEFIGETLDADPIPIAPGIFFVFKDTDAEQRFLLNRQNSRRNVLRLTQRPYSQAQPRLTRAEQKYQAARHLLEPLWQQTLELGRLPEKSEIAALVEVTEAFGTANKALRFMLEWFGEDLLEKARQSRIDDLLTYFALQAFAKRKAYKHLDATLQKDIKAFFGDYNTATAAAQKVLFKISDADLLIDTCRQAAENGHGHLDDEDALFIQTGLALQLPALLRIYIGYATVLYGDLEQTDLIKIHSQTGKLSLMRYDDFTGQPLPRLLERVKINLREQTFDLFQYGEEFEPTYLYLKSRYINEEFPNYAQQLNFDEQLQALNLFDLSRYGPKPDEFRETLAKLRWEIDDFELIRSRSLPNLDDNCGGYLTYRHLIECGETQQNTGLPNLPKQPDSYNALYDLAVNILDPAIEYFGMFRLTYGFCSHELGKLIKKRVAPKLDQHAAHERNTRNNLICPRLGAAVDFIVEDENMREVADWIAENTPFDRLYFYGENRPIHVSYGPEQKREYIDMVATESGKQVPRKRRLA
ncbi:DNA phosphorothioation-associated putative methyltransferase [Methylotuvimicrobium buryatense]|uniref:DNA phosphorothioation-associated putative methyltransferase n=1 Tax=Methylotuvimicrobium buryatense TaxID=95641 RepID=A0A4P9ULW9_METBY|nr:DNA phosphorothioation-associated putative methyltransferase [Methylotuvimicrobium buryatense]QCW82127.1 DNA phosphorothioation-associated putative methyltransferase [Methylotuvimicrobium buryatense]